MQGLRTLAIGTRVMDEQWLSEWDSRYQEAAALLEGRDEATEELMEEVEKDLELVGVSAIEDKLQDGVPAAIQTLLDAGIKVACSIPIWAPLWAFLCKALYRGHAASQARSRKPAEAADASLSLQCCTHQAARQGTQVSSASGDVLIADSLEAAELKSWCH